MFDSVVCDNGTETATGFTGITVAAGGDTECTFTNTQLGELEWEKRSSINPLPLIGGAVFQLTPDDTSLPVIDIPDCIILLATAQDCIDADFIDHNPTGGQYLVVNLTPGDYVLTEFSPPPGFLGIPNPHAVTIFGGQTTTIGTMGQVDDPNNPPPQGEACNPDIDCDFINPPIDAMFIIIDEDSIDNDDEPFTTTRCYQYLDPNSFTMLTAGPGCGEFPSDTATPVNANLSLSPGTRIELPYFDQNPGAIIEIQTGHITDHGWYAPQVIPDSWVAANPDHDEMGNFDGMENFIGIRNFVGVDVPGDPVELVPAPGLGVGAGSEELLDNIPDVFPIRYQGLLDLVGEDICAVVKDSDVSINYNPEPPGGVLDGNLQGNYKGVVAFRVLQVIPFGSFSPGFVQDPQEIAKVRIGILDAVNDSGTGVCQSNMDVFVAPFIVDENTSLIGVPDADLDTGFDEPRTPDDPLPFP